MAEARGFTIADVREVAEPLGLVVSGEDMSPGRGGVVRCSFRLRLDSTRPLGSRPYQRLSRSTLGNGRRRRVDSACWHAWRDVLRPLFDRHPDAIIRTALATYRGRADFAASFEATGSTGNAAASPYGFFTSFEDACECGPDVRNDYGITTGTLDADLGQLVNVRVLRSSAVLACPHVIIDPAHYGDDGRCRCSDPAEQARLIRECGYTAADFAVEVAS